VSLDSLICLILVLKLRFGFMAYIYLGIRMSCNYSYFENNSHYNCYLVSIQADAFNFDSD